MRSPHPNTPVSKHGPNPVGGRDLVAGDLHGEFDTLEHALEALDFKPAIDRLFTLGDLIDRGPRSADALDWLERGRFAGGTRGNHEQMMVNALLGYAPFVPRDSSAAGLWISNGCDWWYESEEAERVRAGDDLEDRSPLIGRWLEAIRTMSYVTTIEYPGRHVGLVHSPGALDAWIHWSRMCEWVANVCAETTQRPGGATNPVEFDLLWREPVALWERDHDPQLGEPVPDVDLVLTGHCPGTEPRWARPNVVCIDTGCHYEEFGHLTIAEVQEGLVLHRFARTERFRA